MTEQELDIEFARRFDTEGKAKQRAAELGKEWSAIRLKPRKYWQLARSV